MSDPPMMLPRSNSSHPPHSSPGCLVDSPLPDQGAACLALLAPGAADTATGKRALDAAATKMLAAAPRFKIKIERSRNQQIFRTTAGAVTFTNLLLGARRKEKGADELENTLESDPAFLKFKEELEKGEKVQEASKASEKEEKGELRASTGWDD